MVTNFIEEYSVCASIETCSFIHSNGRLISLLCTWYRVMIS